MRRHLRSRHGALMRNSTHTSRTLMLSELTQLLEVVDDPHAQLAAYVSAIVADNCLRKRSTANRKATAKHLAGLYGLNPALPDFSALRYLWQRSADAQPLLALLCAYSRDPLLHASASLIGALPEGAAITREDTEHWLEQTEPGRFSPATRRSTSRNLNSSWTQSGHLHGKVAKTRARVNATPAAAAYAVFLAYGAGLRGMSLLSSDTCRLLDCSPQMTLDLLRQASRQGWITLHQIDDVLDVRFPHFSTA